LSPYMQWKWTGDVAFGNGASEASVSSHLSPYMQWKWTGDVAFGNGGERSECLQSFVSIHAVKMNWWCCLRQRGRAKRVSPVICLHTCSENELVMLPSATGAGEARVSSRLSPYMH
jgi:hypothetical protein